MSYVPPTGADAGADPAGPTSELGTVALRDAADGGSAGPGGNGANGGPGGSPPGGGEATGGARTPHRRSTRRWLVEWAIVVVVAVLVALVVRTFVAQTYFVPSTSMYPTLKAGDRIVVDKLTSSIHRGDIVVFRRPPAENCGGPPVPDLVKRVIGLPGESISASGGHVYITGRQLRQPWLPKGHQSETTNFSPRKIPAGDYFMMGDNRINSCDSRMWGPVKRSYIVGKVFLILWPPSRLHFF